MTDDSIKLTIIIKWLTDAPNKKHFTIYWVDYHQTFFFVYNTIRCVFISFYSPLENRRLFLFANFMVGFEHSAYTNIHTWSVECWNANVKDKSLEAKQASYAGIAQEQVLDVRIAFFSLSRSLACFMYTFSASKFKCVIQNQRYSYTRKILPFIRLTHMQKHLRFQVRICWAGTGFCYCCFGEVDGG